MAADTPVVWGTAETGVRANEAYTCIGSPYGGAGAFRERRWQLSLTNSFPAVSPNLVWEGGLRESDSHVRGEQWAEVHGCLARFPVGTVIYRSCLDRNTLSESSAWATGVAFTVEADPLTASRLLGAH